MALIKPQPVWLVNFLALSFAQNTLAYVKLDRFATGLILLA